MCYLQPSDTALAQELLLYIHLLHKDPPAPPPSQSADLYSRGREPSSEAAAAAEQLQLLLSLAGAAQDHPPCVQRVSGLALGLLQSSALENILKSMAGSRADQLSMLQCIRQDVCKGVRRQAGMT